MPRINLLPWREALRKKRQKDFVTHAGLALIGAGALALLAHMTVQGQIDDQIQRNTYLEGVIADLDKKIEEIKALKQKRDDLIARMGAIEKIQATRSLIVRIFDALARTVPEGIILTNVSVGEGANSLRIDGFSDTSARVAEYLSNLNRTELFENAEIIGEGILAKEQSNAPGAKNATKSSFDGRYAFSINTLIVPPASSLEGAGDAESKK